MAVSFQVRARRGPTIADDAERGSIGSGVSLNPEAVGFAHLAAYRTFAAGIASPAPQGIDGTSGDDTIDGTSGDDVINGLGGNDTLRGLGGNDILDGGTGVDRLEGGLGNDKFYVNTGDIVIEGGGAGYDIVYASTDYVLNSGARIEELRTTNDLGTDPLNLTGNNENNFIFGNAGNNVLDGGTAANTLAGGAGDDTYYVNTADSVVESVGGGYDTVYSRSTDFTLTAGAQVEVLASINDLHTGPTNLFGNEHSTYIRANDGNNILDAGLGGLDTLEGRLGNDSYYLDGNDVVIELAGQGNDIIYARSDYVLAAGVSVETLGTISQFELTSINLTGNELDNYISGNAGNNLLDGGPGGADTLWGRGGDDSYYADINDNVIENINDGFDVIYARTTYGLPAGAYVEVLGTIDNLATTKIDLYGNSFDNYLTGNAGANSFEGGTGGDTMWGRDGDDSYFVESDDVVIEYAGQGYDIIYARGNFTLGVGVAVEVIGTLNNFGTQDFALTGNELANYVSGNAGPNTINGGGGADNLQGREGADTFMFDTALGGGNIDTILDFGNGPDRIALDDSVFAGLAIGALAAGAFRTGAAAQDADDRILYDPTNGALYFDDDGNGGHAAVHFATLATAPAITAADFIVF